MLENDGFDAWSGRYDEDILKMQNDGYPFQGYYETLGYVQNYIKDKKASAVLDIGIGTGLLSEVLYEMDIAVTGLDFSDKMLQKAAEKMPLAEFIKHDFVTGLPYVLKDRKFDFIVSSYAIHHLTDGKKVQFIGNLIRNLNVNGAILLADVAFLNRRELDVIREKATDWDDDEHYIVANELSANLAQQNLITEFVKTSPCSGVFVILPQDSNGTFS